MNNKAYDYCKKSIKLKTTPKYVKLQMKEFINICDGKRLGFDQDVTADFKTGTISEIIVPGNNKIFNLFTSGNELVIPWSSIKTIGEDVILVDF